MQDAAVPPPMPIATQPIATPCAKWACQCDHDVTIRCWALEAHKAHMHCFTSLKDIGAARCRLQARFPHHLTITEIIYSTLLVTAQ